MSIEPTPRRGCLGLPLMSTSDANHLENFNVRVFTVWDVGWMGGDSKVHLTDILPSLMALWTNRGEQVMELGMIRSAVLVSRRFIAGNRVAGPGEGEPGMIMS